MITSETYLPFYDTADPETANKRLCIEDRLAIKGLQTPGEVAGDAVDFNLALRALGRWFSTPLLTEFALEANGAEDPHDGGCAARINAYNTFKWIAEADPAKQMAAVASTGLNIKESIVERQIDTARRFSRLRPQPDTAAAIAALARRGVTVESNLVTVGGRVHTGDNVLINTGNLQFDPEAARAAGLPAYNLDIVRAAHKNRALLATLRLTPEDYMSAQLLRTIALGGQLPTGKRGHPVGIVVMNTLSFARDDR